MCDGLSEFSSEDGKVTAVSLTNLEQGIELLSQVGSETVVGASALTSYNTTVYNLNVNVKVMI